MKRLLVIYGLLIIGFSQKSLGQENLKFSLSEAISFAMENHAKVKNAKTDVKISDKKIFETTAIGLPQINSEGNFQHFIERPTTFLPAKMVNPQADEDELVGIQFGTEYNITGNITANQLLFDGSYIVGLQAAKTYGKLAVINQQKTETEIKESVSKAYYLALVAVENKEIIRETLENFRKQAHEIEIIHLNGLNEELDVDQATLTTRNLENALKRAERQTLFTNQMLKFEMGIENDMPLELSENLLHFIENMKHEAIFSDEFSTTNNPDYQLAQTQLELMTLNLKKERFSYFPTLAAFAQHQQQAAQNDMEIFGKDKWFPSTLWGINLKIPIFSSGMRAAKVTQAKLEMEKSQNNLELMNQGLKVQFQLAKDTYYSTYEVFLAEKENLKIAEKIQSSTLKKHKEGLASTFELTQIQNQYLTTQGNYIKSIMELLNAKTDLEKLYAK